MNKAEKIAAYINTHEEEIRNAAAAAYADALETPYMRAIVEINPVGDGVEKWLDVSGGNSFHPGATGIISYDGGSYDIDDDITDDDIEMRMLDEKYGLSLEKIAEIKREAENDCMDLLYEIQNNCPEYAKIIEDARTAAREFEAENFNDEEVDYAVARTLEELSADIDMPEEWEAE